jgi:hypothetical protein
VGAGASVGADDVVTGAPAAVGAATAVGDATAVTATGTAVTGSGVCPSVTARAWRNASAISATDP